MSTIGQLNVAGAKADPARHFANPAAVVDTVMLTRGEKIATLERWRLDILRELDAANEGMRTYGRTTKHTALLNEIEAARQQLVTGGSDGPAASTG
jgi:hypothetical protein